MGNSISYVHILLSFPFGKKQTCLSILHQGTSSFLLKEGS